MSSHEVDRDLILNPKRWPLGYHLPMVRRTQGSFPEVGFMLDHPDHKTTVFVDNMMSITKVTDLPQSKYDDVDALLADGWEVD